MNFFLFVLATATIFIRPGEIFTALHGFEFFFYLIIPCILLSFPSILAQMTQRNLQVQPITLCVFGLMVAVVVSNLVHFDIETDMWMLFLKNVVYYILLVSLVNTPSRFMQILFWVWLFALVFSAVALLQYFGYIELNFEDIVKNEYEDESGETTMVSRMIGSGLFADPNDMCVVIIMGFILSVYWAMGDHLFRLPRLLYLASSLVFGFALLKTQSRSGFISLMVSSGVLLLIRYGLKKGAMLGAAALPLVLIVFSGRITKISSHEATGQSRIWLWDNGFGFFKSSPLFGIGAGKFQVFDDSHHAAHNAYVNSYAELGLFGGTLFVGAFFFSAEHTLPYG